MPVFLSFTALSRIVSACGPLFPLQGISLVLLDHDLHIVRLSDIRRIRADRITALNDAILDNGIIPNIHVI